MSTSEHSSTRGRKREISKLRQGSGLVGYDELMDLFVKMADERRLFQSYIFFGESGVGKFTFADRLANYLEFGSLDESKIPRSETMVITAAKDKESIGIDMIRDMKYFLSEQPSASAYRTVIIDGADNLTDQAQNALLKVSEEPPAHGLLMLIVDSPENLLPTLRSRFHKVYFPRLSGTEIAGYLKSIWGLEEKAAIEAAESSFGRMGRALQLVLGSEPDIKKDALKGLRDRAVGRKLFTEALDEPERLNGIIREMIAELARDPERNLVALKELLKRTTLNGLFNTNKRLQLEAVLWNI
jgi:DNA polymerase III subunit delta'